MKFADVPFNDLPFGGSGSSSSYNNASSHDGFYGKRGGGGNNDDDDAAANNNNNNKDTATDENDDTTKMKLYDVLGIDKDADDKTIKKAYRKLCLVHHPDKGGDEQKFQEINAAHEVLSDPEKRKLYDRYGLDGLEQQQQQQHSAAGEDLFSMFFGGAGRRRRRNGGGGHSSSFPKRGPNINHPLKVSLEDLYNGRTKKLAINRKIIVGETKECTACHGRGVVTETKSMGPGMITQMQRGCDECNGRGRTARTKTDRTVVEVHIEKGAMHNETITFRNMADEIPGCDEIGDVNFIIQEQEHPIFQRKNADLLMTQTISLNQALCGFSVRLEHLDGRTIIVKTKPGQIIQSESTTTATTATGGRRRSTSIPYTMIVPNEGMPSKGNPFVKGNLHVLFRIEFPKTLSKESIEALRTILPDPNAVDEEENNDDDDDDDPMDIEEHFLVENNDDDDHHRHKFGTGGDAIMSDAASYYDDDTDDDGNGHQNVQCQQS